MSTRPTVTVIVPFTGSDDALRACLQGLSGLRRRGGDEVLVADNRRRPGSEASSSPADESGMRVVAARGRCAPGFARNRAAALAAGEWLVFVDADARPDARLLDGYFDAPPRPGTAVLAGRILDVPGSSTVTARHSAGRAQLSQRVTLDRAGTPYAQSANMAVRRSAFAAVGGFDGSARAGEDADLCFRLARAGWQLEERPGAVVRHASRGTLTGLVAQLARHGSGAAWLNRRYPGEFPPPTWSAFGRRTASGGAGAVTAAVRGRRDGAEAALVELIGAWAFEAGRLLPNRARRS